MSTLNREINGELIEFSPGYYYKHTNGKIIWKPRIVVDSDSEYFNSPFVVKVWDVKTEEDFTDMLDELDPPQFEEGINL